MAAAAQAFASSVLKLHYWTLLDQIVCIFLDLSPSWIMLTDCRDMTHSETIHLPNYINYGIFCLSVTPYRQMHGFKAL